MSRMRRATGGGGDEETPGQNGATSHKTPLTSNGDEACGAFSPGDLLDEDSDPGLRKEIRSKYRHLITTIQRE